MRLVPISAGRALCLSCPPFGLISTNLRAPYLLKIERCIMSPCSNCFNHPHCSRLGGSQPCKYYVGPAMKEMPNRPRELTAQRPCPAAGEAGLNHVQQHRKERRSQKMTPSVIARRTVRIHNAAPPCGGPHWSCRYPHKYALLTMDIQYIRIAWVAATDQCLRLTSYRKNG